MHFFVAITVSSQVVSSGKYETPKRVLPGMYIYADGLIYPEIIEGRQVMAIVGSVDGSDVLAVCLQEACLPWSSDWLEAKATQKMTGGKEATRKILEISRKKRQEAEAAQWCYDYAEDGVKQGEAFLPSLTELEKLFANKAAINASLNALGVALLEGWYWSSTESGSDWAWVAVAGTTTLRPPLLRSSGSSFKTLIISPFYPSQFVVAKDFFCLLNLI